MTTITPEQRLLYSNAGFFLARSLLIPADFAPLEDEFERLTQRGAAMGADTQALYSEMRASSKLASFALTPALNSAAGQLLNRARWRLAPYTRFRMDQPRDVRWLALWHQDHAYMPELHIDTVTAWIPLQDTPWEMGPLLVAPESHHHGERTHGKVGDRQVAFPPASAPIEAVPMNRGDVLFFHSLLLHSGQVNFTDRVRYSVQARFEPL
jgi:hypothetical protein